MSRTLLITILTVFVCAIAPSGASGAIWGADGAPVCLQPETQRNPQLVSDGQGGMVVAWADARVNGTSYYVYVQRLDGSGRPMWFPRDGFPIGFANHPNREVIDVVSDGAQGAIVVWTATGPDIYAQKLNANGDIQWPTGGVTVGDNARSTDAVVTPDGIGGIIVAWPEDAGPQNDIYAQRITASGTQAWPAGPPGGIQVFPSGGWQGDLGIIADGLGGAAFAARA